MITKASESLLNAIKEKEKYYLDIARRFAVSYAQTDEKHNKESFELYSRIADEYRKLHGDICQAANAIEQEMLELAKQASSE